MPHGCLPKYRRGGEAFAPSNGNFCSFGKRSSIVVLKNGSYFYALQRWECFARLEESGSSGIVRRKSKTTPAFSDAIVLFRLSHKAMICIQKDRVSLSHSDEAAMNGAFALLT
jgi:hypothetical protein